MFSSLWSLVGNHTGSEKSSLVSVLLGLAILTASRCCWLREPVLNSCLCWDDHYSAYYTMRTQHFPT
jgi:hypothetical protein